MPYIILGLQPLVGLALSLSPTHQGALLSFNKLCVCFNFELPRSCIFIDYARTQTWETTFHYHHDEISSLQEEEQRPECMCSVLLCPLTM
jgi:hypothetical protein